jgi:hypothetical protein
MGEKMTDVIITLSADNLVKLKQGTIIKKLVPIKKLLIFLGKNLPSKDEEDKYHGHGWNTTSLPVTDAMLVLIEKKETDVDFHYDDFRISLMSEKTYQKRYGIKATDGDL